MTTRHSTAMKYLRPTRGKTVALAICLVCTILLTIALPVLKPTVLDFWYRQRLRSSDPAVRARAAQAVCANPSPRAVRELILMYSREDDAASTDVLVTGGLPLLAQILEAVREEATWFLESVPYVENIDHVHSYGLDNDLVMLRETWGSRYFLEEAHLKRPGEPSPQRLKTLLRSTEVISRILKEVASDLIEESLYDLGDPELLMIFAALGDIEQDLPPLACFLYPLGLRSSKWLVRSATLDVTVLGDCAMVTPEEIVAVVRDPHPIVKAKALQTLALLDEAPRLPLDLLSEVAAMLREPVCATHARDVLCKLSAVDGLSRVVLDAVGLEYAKCLENVPRKLGELSTEEYYFLRTIDGIARVFDCEQVSSFVDLLSPSSGRAEMALHVLASMDCPVPISAVDTIKRFVASDVNSLREHALLLCRDLSGIDDELTSVLLEATTDDDASIRGAALRGLGNNRLADDMALELFSNALLDDSQYCRNVAISELEDLGERARKPLLDFLKAVKRKEADEDDDPNLVERLETALRRLAADERGSEE